MSSHYAKAIKKHSGKDPSESRQKELGTPRAGDLSGDHSSFLKEILKLIDDGKIDLMHPHSFINDDVYKELNDEVKGMADRAIPNIISLLERVMDLHARDESNESIEMKNLIDALWQAKQRVEAHADVFIF